jgi:hypothetical protein
LRNVARPETANGLAERGAAFEPRFRDGPIANAEGHLAAMLRDPDDQVIYLVNIPGVTRADMAAA